MALEQPAVHEAETPANLFTQASVIAEPVVYQSTGIETWSIEEP